MSTIWTDHIDSRFQTVPANPSEKDYYPPYNKLLNHLFPPDTPFTVSPHPGPYPPQDPRPHSVDSYVYIEYHILYEDVVIFILQVKSGPRLLLLGARQEADNQIRRRLLELTDLCPLSRGTLRAISAFGTRVCLYESQHVSQGIAIRPRRNQNEDSDHDVVLDVTPESWWNLDVMQPAGAQELRRVAELIKEECQRMSTSDVLLVSAGRAALTLGLRYFGLGVPYCCLIAKNARSREHFSQE